MFYYVIKFRVIMSFSIQSATSADGSESMSESHVGARGATIACVGVTGAHTAAGRGRVNG